jgi:hypothetical protein
VKQVPRRDLHRRPFAVVKYHELGLRFLLSRSVYDALGLSFALEKHGSGPEHHSARVGFAVLELYPATGPATPLRIGLRVENFEPALVALASCVLHANASAHPKSALLRDPDGNKVLIPDA